MTTGEIIKQLRKERKMSQEDLAEYIGVQKSAVAKWEGCSDSLELFYLCVLHFVALKNAPPVWLG